MKNKVVVVGGGGHSKVVCDILLRKSDIDIIGVLDLKCVDICGLKYLGNDEILSELDSDTAVFVAIGDNSIRKRVIQSIRHRIINAIGSISFVSEFSTVNSGVTIMNGAIIQAYTRIGEGAIINTNASVDHDCIIGTCVHVAPGCSICGRVIIGECSFIGVGTSVIDGISIGKNVTIGAGSTVINNIPDNCVAVGSPAKIIKYKESSI